jgi:antitoxin component YwqK of YwqJK toxin-antitoxin module
MECGTFGKFLKEKDCNNDAVPTEIKKHLGECETCQSHYRFTMLLGSQKGVLEKAPEEILPFVEKEILARSEQLTHRHLFPRFSFPLRPTFAGFAVSFLLLVAVLSYAYLANKNIGYVENLSERFKIAQFENIKSGDVLYTGDNTTATIRLKSKSKLQIHQNTIVRVNGSRQIALSRGEISLLSEDKELRIETPGGLLLARNANTKINTIARLENGVLKTETTCIVFNGKLIIKYPYKEIILNQGQKAVLVENGSITSQKQLTTAESESEKSTAVKQKIVSAVQSLCDCIHAFNYAPGKKGNHLQLFGKEVNENKFKVHVFWKEKELNEQVFGPSGEKSKTCFISIRRRDG